jgi:hypothetical protein
MPARRRGSPCQFRRYGRRICKALRRYCTVGDFARFAGPFYQLFVASEASIWFMALALLLD